MTCNNPDRPSYGDYLVYESTQKRWESEGLPKGLNQAALYDYFGFDKIDFWIDGNLIAQTGPIPAYEEMILEETGDYIIKRVGNGDVVKYLKNTPPPAMPQFISHPVTDRKSWDEFKKRLDHFGDWFNERRVHSALQGRTPQEAWEGRVLPAPVPIRARDQLQPQIEIQRRHYHGDLRLPVIDMSVRLAA